MVAATTRPRSASDERVGAGRRAAGDRAWLECDVSCAAVNAIACMRSGLAEGDDFSVVAEIVFVPALADDLAGAVENDAADSRVRRGDTDAAARELKRTAHPVEVEVGGCGHTATRRTVKFTCREESGFSGGNDDSTNFLTNVYRINTLYR